MGLASLCSFVSVAAGVGVMTVSGAGVDVGVDTPRQAASAESSSIPPRLVSTRLVFEVAEIAILVR